MALNTCCSLFPLHHFVCNYTHKSKTTGSIRMLYLSNEYSTIGDIYFLGWSYMWDTISDLWIQTGIATSFQYDIFCLLMLIAQKLQVIYEHSTYQITDLLSEMSVFCVESGCEYDWWLMAPNMHCSLFSNQPIVHTYMHTLKNTGHIWMFCMTALLFETCSHGLELYERSNWRATAPNTHWWFSDTTLCAFTASLYMHHYLVQNYAWQQNSCTLWLHTTHQRTALLTMMHHFNKKKFS